MAGESLPDRIVIDLRAVSLSLPQDFVYERIEVDIPGSTLVIGSYEIRLTAEQMAYVRYYFDHT